MSWSDCLLLGQQLINIKAFNQTKEWIDESLKRYSMEEKSSVATELDFMEKLGENLMKTGDTTAALEVFRAVVIKDPHRLSTVSAIYNNTHSLSEALVEEEEYHVSFLSALHVIISYQQVLTTTPAKSPL